MVEEGFVKPGGFCVASDSHSNTYGAVAALGTPVVRTDAAALWATGTVWWQVPRTVKVVLEGALRPGVTGKDVIITLCGLYNQGEVLNAVLEFTGPGRGLPLDGGAPDRGQHDHRVGRPGRLVPLRRDLPGLPGRSGSGLAGRARHDRAASPMPTWRPGAPTPPPATRTPSTPPRSCWTWAGSPPTSAAPTRCR